MMNTVKILKNFILTHIFNFNFKILVPIVTEISVGGPWLVTEFCVGFL